jgi:hypothetical protein
MKGGSGRCKKYKKWKVVFVSVKNIKKKVGSSRCKKYKKSMVVIINIKNIKNE